MNSEIDSILEDIDNLLCVHRNPLLKKLLIDRIKHRMSVLSAGLPKDPPGELLWSMARRLHHDFGLNAEDDDGPIAVGFTEREREVVLADMRRLYEEVSGNGFFQWKDVTKT